MPIIPETLKVKSEVTTSPLDALLCQAIDRKDIDECRSLLEQGANPNTSRGTMRTALTYAIEHGFTAGALALLEYGARVNEQGPGRCSALHIAARVGDLDACKELLARGARINADESNRGTALTEAARKERLDVCALLLERGADPNYGGGGGDGGRPPLKLAALSESIDLCRLLVAGGADPAYTPLGATRGYLTPFQWAVAFAAPAVAGYFLESFPHLAHEQTLDGQTLLDLASGENLPLLRSAITASEIRSSLEPPMGDQAPASGSKGGFAL